MKLTLLLLEDMMATFNFFMPPSYAASSNLLSSFIKNGISPLVPENGTNRPLVSILAYF